MSVSYYTLGLSDWTISFSLFKNGQTFKIR